jgi:SAM-dependent methyltransferase
MCSRISSVNSKCADVSCAEARFDTSGDRNQAFRMGIPSQVARLILREHLFRPITGKLLSIGRQTVHLTPRQAKTLVEAELGIRLDVDPLDLEIDTSTRGARDHGLISDRAFFSLFSDATYHCLDQSDYENADIVFDLCSARIPSELEDRFDFVVEGSTLDNVFDPAAALRNLARITRAEGRLFHHNRASRRHNVYVAFALSWFHDYYSVNEFEDCQVYLAQWDADQITSRWDVYHYRPLQEHNGEVKYFGQDTWYYPWRHAHAIVIAEKGSQSTSDKHPIQFEYRPGIVNTLVDEKFETLPQDLLAADENPYLKAALRFSRSRRPPAVKPHEKAQIAPEFVNYAPEIVYCGSIDAVLD